MALKPTIYKFRIALSDVNRNYYDNLNLTVAQHPSETRERMMARVLAFCLNAHDQLTFTKGLSAVEEPDLWIRALDDTLSLWIDVGEPAVDRLKKATHKASAVMVYSFNVKSDVWWQQGQAKLKELDLSIYQFPWPDIQALAKLVQRTMDISITITDDAIYIAAKAGECEVSCILLQSL